MLGMRLHAAAAAQYEPPVAARVGLSTRSDADLRMGAPNKVEYVDITAPPMWGAVAVGDHGIGTATTCWRGICSIHWRRCFV